jgi:hypothetical protein
MGISVVSTIHHLAYRVEPHQQPTGSCRPRSVDKVDGMLFQPSVVWHDEHGVSSAWSAGFEPAILAGLDAQPKCTVVWTEKRKVKLKFSENLV